VDEHGRPAQTHDKNQAFMAFAITTRA